MWQSRWPVWVPFRCRLVGITVALVLGFTRAAFLSHQRAHYASRPAQVAVEYDDDSGDEPADLGGVYQQPGDLEGSVEGLTQLIEIEPGKALLYLKRGRAYEQKGEHDRALADFTEAIRLDPKMGDAYYGRGLIREGKKDYDLAIEDLSQALRLRGEKVEIHLHRGNCHAGRKDLGKALGDFQDALRIDPQNAQAYAARGWVHKERKEYEEAVADYGEAVKLDPKEPSGYNELAWLWATCPREEHRNGKMAVEYALYVCRLTDWKEGIYLDTLAAGYAEDGQFEEAVKWQKKALEMAGAYNGEEQRKEGQKRLELYEAGKPFREK